MKIYIASRWSRRIELQVIRDTLHRRGHDVMSSWIDAQRPENPDEKFFISAEGRQRLRTDIADLNKSDIVVADILGGMGRRGGMMIEIGYAVGCVKPVYLVGNPVELGVFGNIFLETFPDWSTMISEIL